MQRELPIYEDINDALRAVVKACGGTKEVASKLWPEKPVNEAQSYLNDCLNTARAAHLFPEQVILLLKWGKDAGFHDALIYVCDETGYTRPSPVEPEDELARLQREYIEAVKTLQTLTPKIDEARLRVAK